MTRVQIFLSTVSAEFRSYRDKLRHDLTGPNVSVAVQEDFIATGTETLDMQDDYIRRCDAVIHLVGDMTGAPAQAPSLEVIRKRYPDLGEKLPPLAPFLQPGAPALSYTQWEAWLALYHGKPLIIAAPEDKAPRDTRFERIPEQRAAQQAHLQRLAVVERYPGISFSNPDRLAVGVLRSRLQEILARAGPLVRPTNLPFRSLGALFKGRETELDDLKTRLGPIPDSSSTPANALVLNGLGGVGKTRLAIEYAWRHDDQYTALLFVGADSGESLQRNLGALCASEMLDLPEKTEREEARQYEAVLKWLKKAPGWLLILDNVDSKPAATAVEALLPQLTGGHVLLTSRLADWSAGLAPVELDVLAPEAAVDFLLTRTDAKRRKQANDPGTACTLADELGRLALALEQAGAYIVQRRLSFDGYLAEWQGQRDKVLAWFDQRLIQYPKPVAIAWQTSFDQLTAPARQLLQRLAWLSPDPIPEALLEVPVPEATGQADALEALIELESYSLVNRAADIPSFSVHRLVQEVTRRSQRDEPQPTPLLDALRWINAAFVGDSMNPADWPVLVPLLPHAQAVSRHADAARLTEPTARLMNQAGLLLYTKAQYAEAEPLYQRALAIREQALGPEHPAVAQSLNNLAELYNNQGAYAQAEPLYQRALAIRENALGPTHPNVAQSLNNLAVLYNDKGAYAEAEPLCQRALALVLKSLGNEHPTSRTVLENYEGLLQAMGKAEAEISDAIQSLKQHHTTEAP